MLKANNVTIQFGGLTAVNDVSLEIEKDTICGLIGPNGAGKTTFFNIISGVMKPTKGAVVFDGKDITGMYPYKINEIGISRTYQSINLFRTMSVTDNVLVGMHSRLRAGLAGAVLRTAKQRKEEKAAVEKVESLLNFVGMVDKRHSNAGSLPYGEQRLVEIVRALANDPKMILLDEPGAGMNSREKIDLTETIGKIRQRGVTVLLVEHDMKLVMGVTDYIYVLNYGKKIAQGDPLTIQNHPDVIQAYLGGE
jgi:branched-chain amino acid transport system ATP-binding protein